MGVLPALVSPPRLAPGDTVALVAPGGPVSPERVEGAAGLLRARGLRVRVRPDLTDRDRYLAGDDERRAGELLDALSDPEVKAVFLARGGYGSQRLLARLPAAAPASPRAVVGFSDNTALLNHLRQRWGWATLHGPHPRAECPDELDAVLGCLGYYGAPGRPAARGLMLLNPGPWERVQAEVAGGCLSIVSSSVGTPYALTPAGRILFLEDVGEPAYRLDRMLHHLRASGTLEGVRAVVFGRTASFSPPEEPEGFLDGLLREFAAGASFPVLTGLAAGHTEPNLPVPFGPRALLDSGAGFLHWLEDLVP